ncbi:MAG: MoxR family ATPase [Phaeodactylibacter sp.]|nr:MoxR family ATPase [Phaeodactylibacter sp.]
MSFHLYSESGQRDLPKITLNEKINDPRLYLPPKGLVGAVNVAINLGQPLLLTGEPGTGKTQLAHHVAHYFKLGKVVVFNAQTTSTAKDLFYRYDALGHFQYSQTQAEPLTPEQVEEKYIRYQALGAAIRSQSRRVVLLDEIDKAPRDLPNDVLAALEELRFDVPEVGKSFETTIDNRPLIIMTSNSEKNLPDAFLRRVAYFHIEFPTPEDLLRILRQKLDGFDSESGNKQLDAIIEHFNMIRAKDKVKLKKPPATAELIQWAALLRKMDFDASRLANLKGLSGEEREQLGLSYSVLAKNKDDLKALIGIL